jgi:hypothetical protein
LHCQFPTFANCWHCRSIQFPTSSACLLRSDVPSIASQERHIDWRELRPNPPS